LNPATLALLRTGRDTEGMAKRPRDLNQLAKLVVDIASGEAEDSVSESKRSASPARGRAGGVKGAAVRAARLLPEQRSDIAKKAAKARWSNRQTGAH
jgi:hypothetical protein